MTNATVAEVNMLDVSDFASGSGDAVLGTWVELGDGDGIARRRRGRSRSRSSRGPLAVKAPETFGDVEDVA